MPITSITNGVHAPTWVHPALKAVSERAFGDAHTDAHDWTDGEVVSDGELWGVRAGDEAASSCPRRGAGCAASVRATGSGVEPAWVDRTCSTPRC